MSAPQPQPLWKQLDRERRERLFTLMSRLGSEARGYFARGRETPGTLAVGAALFDETLQGAIREELVSALRTAPSVELAKERASAAVREWVRKHNEKRSDINWQRWSENGQDALNHLVSMVAEAVK